MNVTSQTVEMSEGDKVELVMPNGAVITVGCGDSSFAEKDEPWIVTQGESNDRGFRLTEKGKLKEFDLQ